MERRKFVKATAITIALAAAGFITQPAVAADTIKVGILHSLSGNKADMLHNSATPLIEVYTETYAVRADGEPLVCEPAHVLPMAQRYFMF